MKLAGVFAMIVVASFCLSMEQASAAGEQGELRTSLSALQIFPCLKASCGGKPSVDPDAAIRADR